MEDRPAFPLPRRALRGPGASYAGELVPTTDFVVMCHPRSGSNLLIHALREHPSVRVYGEIFQDDFDARLSAYRGRHEVYLPGMDGAEFLHSIFRECHFDEIMAIGFKLFYEQARSGTAMSAWDYVRRRKDIRVLHLSRSANLEAYVSLCEARASDNWVLEAGRQRPEEMPPIKIDVDDCLAFLNEVHVHSAWARTAFADHPFLDLDYQQELRTCFPATMKAVQEFLGIPVIDLPQQTQKQATRPLEARVTNLNEVRHALRHTIHASSVAETGRP